MSDDNFGYEFLPIILLEMALSCLGCCSQWVRRRASVWGFSSLLPSYPGNSGLTDTVQFWIQVQALTAISSTLGPPFLSFCGMVVPFGGQAKAGWVGPSLRYMPGSVHTYPAQPHTPT